MFFWLGEKLRALGTQISVLCSPLPFVIVQGQSPSFLEHMVLFLIVLLSIFGGERSNCMGFFYSDKAKTFGSRLISFGELPMILSSYFRAKWLLNSITFLWKLHNHHHMFILRICYIPSYLKNNSPSPNFSWNDHVTIHPFRKNTIKLRTGKAVFPQHRCF